MDFSIVRSNKMPENRNIIYITIDENDLFAAVAFLLVVLKIIHIISKKKKKKKKSNNFMFKSTLKKLFNARISKFSFKWLFNFYKFHID